VELVVADPGQAGRWSTARPQALRGYRAHRSLAGHEVLVDDRAAATGLAATHTEPGNMSTFSAAPLWSPAPKIFGRELRSGLDRRTLCDRLGPGRPRLGCVRAKRGRP